MSLRSSSTPASRPAITVLLFCSATLGGIWAWRAATSPVQQRINAGIQKLESGQGAAAVAEWREAVKLDPDNANAWALLAESFESAQEWPSAIDALKQVLRLRPDTPSIHGRLATAFLASGDMDAASEHAQEALKEDRDDVAALRVAASVSGSQYRREEHLKYLRRLYEILPREPGVLIALAQELSKRHDYKAARPLLDVALQAQPGNAEALNARAQALFSDPTPENLEKAKADWEKVLVLDPRDVEAHRSLGRVAMLQGQPGEAIKHFEAVGQGRPYASGHFLELSQALRAVGQKSRADEMQRRFVSLKRMNIEMHDLNDNISSNPQDLSACVKLALIETACVESGGDGYELYRFHYLGKRLKAPEFYIAQARKLAPTNPQVFDAERRLERVYARFFTAGQKSLEKGNLAAAKQNFDRATVLRPDDARTAKALLQMVVAQKPQ